jgi:hypothetical protein
VLVATVRSGAHRVLVATVRSGAHRVLVATVILCFTWQHW